MITEQRAERVWDFARSSLFDRTFHDGMALVEETSAYLDGPGRQEARMLSRTAAVSYACQSLALTTCLMQASSWLLLQKAVRDGDMDAEQACKEHFRLSDRQWQALAPASDDLPAALTALLDRAGRLYTQLVQLDARLYRDSAQTRQDHPVLVQQDRLQQVFATEA
jgi:regulator of CtrA degradation